MSKTSVSEWHRTADLLPRKNNKGVYSVPVVMYDQCTQYYFVAIFEYDVRQWVMHWDGEIIPHDCVFNETYWTYFDLQPAEIKADFNPKVDE